MQTVLQIILFIGILIITGVVSGIVMLIHTGPLDANMQIGIPVISFILVLLVMNVLAIGFDTIYLSILEDFERNDGSLEKPYYMNDELKELLIKDTYSYIEGQV